MGNKALMRFWKRKKPANPHVYWLFWRSGWDSNPRAVSDKLISSQPRYDHFDTAPRWQRQVRKENYTAWRGKLQMLAEAIPGAA